MKKMTDSETLTAILRATLIGSKDVLTTEECALLTGYSERNIREMCSKRIIPHYKTLGNRLCFDKSEIENWMRHTRISVHEDLLAKADFETFAKRY